MNPTRDVPHRAGVRVHLGRDRGEEAASREVGGLDVAQVAVGEQAQPLEPGRRNQRGLEHLLAEDRAGDLDRCELQLLLRAEVREEPALAHAHGIGQAGDREAVQAVDRGELRGLAQDRVATSLAVAAALADRLLIDSRVAHFLTS